MKNVCYTLGVGLKDPNTNTKNTKAQKEMYTMKHTKNMIYQETPASEELFVFAINDGQTYFQSILPAIENLKKKVKKSVYNSEKAVDLWYYVANFAGERYRKEYGGTFTVQQRYTVACELERYFLEDVNN